MDGATTDATLSVWERNRILVADCVYILCLFISFMTTEREPSLPSTLNSAFNQATVFF